MSIEIDFFPENATKKDLKDFIEAQGFTKTEYFLKPFPKGTLYYAWFEWQHDQSFEGVEAVVWKLTDDITEKFRSKYVLHTRTRAWASAYDQQKQNEFIRLAKKRFGGYFFNDHGGKNRYTKINSDEFLSPMESGLLKIYDRLKDKLLKLHSTLVPIEEPFKEAIKKAEHSDIKMLLTSQKPDQYLYNSLLPFAVSVIEHFFKEVFIILVRYDKQAQNILAELRLKEFRSAILVNDLMEVHKGNSSFERLLANNYTFQNLTQVNDAYKKFLGVDIIALLSKKKIGNKLLKEELTDLIERRHDMIHHFIFMADMDKSRFIGVLKICDMVIELLIEHLETTYNIKVRDHSINKNIEMFPKF